MKVVEVAVPAWPDAMRDRIFRHVKNVETLTYLIVVFCFLSLAVMLTDDLPLWAALLVPWPLIVGAFYLSRVNARRYLDMLIEEWARFYLCRKFNDGGCVRHRD